MQQLYAHEMVQICTELTWSEEHNVSAMVCLQRNNVSDQVLWYIYEGTMMQFCICVALTQLF